MNTASMPLSRLARFGRGAAITLAMAMALTAGVGIAQPAGKPMYELDFDNEVSKAGKLQAIRGQKSYHMANEGAGQEPRVVFDDSRRSKVLDFEVGATPAASHKDRSELAIYSGVDFGKPWWVSMKVLVPKGTQIADNWHSFLQCPQAGIPASAPPFSVSLVAPNKFALVGRSEDDKFNELGTGEFPIGRWATIELELKMGEGGFARMYVDGKLAAAGDGDLRYKKGQPRCTLKVGIYRGKASTPFSMRVDDIRFGTTRESVAQH